MTAEEMAQEAQVAIARIDATLIAIKQQQDHAGRTVEQLVRLVEERLTGRFDALGARFDNLERRLDEMESARRQARVDHLADVKALDLRLDQVEKWQEKMTNRAVGIAIGISLGSGALGALLVTVATRLTS